MQSRRPDPLKGSRVRLIAIIIGALLAGYLAWGGAATLVVGALARDAASAQNFARPVFLVLLVAFFAALATPPGASSWLLYVPPLTPFLLLVNSGGSFRASTRKMSLRAGCTS